MDRKIAGNRGEGRVQIRAPRTAAFAPDLSQATKLVVILQTASLEIAIDPIEIQLAAERAGHRAASSNAPMRTVPYSEESSPPRWAPG